jgi:microcystin degradation protein MlrC
VKVLVATVKHETNTFSPIVTDLKRFEEWGLHRGDAARRAMADTAMPQGAYQRLATEMGAELVTPISAEAMPGGRVTAEAYRALCEPILEAVEQGVDAALLDLHGAMVVEGVSDGEGALLAAIRERSPNLPVAVTCDFHANLTPAMVDNATALIGYKTYPHTDMAEVAE